MRDGIGRFLRGSQGEDDEIDHRSGVPRNRRRPRSVTIAHAGRDRASLYHYQRFNADHLRAAVVDRSIRFSNSGDFNDRWDCKPFFKPGTATIARCSKVVVRQARRCRDRNEIVNI